MAMIEVKTDPSTRDLRVFALAWLVFMPVLGLVLPRMEDGLLVLAGLATACFVLSLALNREEPGGRQALGLLLPGVLVMIWGATTLWADEGVGRGVVRSVILGLFTALGAGGGVGALASRRFGARLYRVWMRAVLPIGWVVSHALLGVAFFGVVTPIGLALRLVGRDPLDRRVDRQADTYWRPREPSDDVRRSMRQF